MLQNVLINVFPDAVNYIHFFGHNCDYYYSHKRYVRLSMKPYAEWRDIRLVFDALARHHQAILKPLTYCVHTELYSLTFALKSW